MQSLGRRHVRYVNATYRHSEILRFKSSLVDNERHLLTCMRHIELNPVRAEPGGYRCRHHVAASAIEWLAEPQEHRRLASSPEACALVYRELFKQPLAAYDIEAILTHQSFNKAWNWTTDEAGRK